MNTPHTGFTCLDFRRAKLADPTRLPPEAHAHLRGCAACQAFAQRADHMEAQYARALAVPLPEGLDERILLAVQARRALPWRAWAMAATVVLTLGTGSLMWSRSLSYDPARFAIEHVLHEPEAFTDARLADAASFRHVVAQFGGELTAPLGEVRYMKLCPGPEGTGWHVVLATPQGMVSLFLIPSDRSVRSRQLAADGYVAMTEAGGRGYYAIVAESESTAAAMARRVREGVRWRT